LTHQFAAARSLDSLTVLGLHHNITASHINTNTGTDKDKDKDKDTQTRTDFTCYFDIHRGARCRKHFVILFEAQWRAARVRRTESLTSRAAARTLLEATPSR